MAEISLIYRLSSDIEENPVKWEVDVLSIDSIISLKERIYEKVFKCDYANSIDAEDLKLWKVQINNKEGDFSRLVPRNMEGAKKLLKGAINDFWEAQPSKEFTHIIVDSPLLTAMKKIEQDQDENTSDYIIPKGPRPGGSHLKDLFHAKIIRKNDVLRIKREYNKISVHIQCRVTNFDDGILSVMLIDRNEEQKEGILLLEDLERWLLEHSLDAKDRPKKYDNPGDNIEIIRNRIWLGSIRMRRNYYINNQELENRYKDSASKSELKQDENLSEEFNRLDITEKKNQSTAKYIDDEEVLPISDDELFPRLETLSCKFWDAYCEDIPSISYVSAEMINGKPAIVAYVNIPKTPVELPAEFKGYPVFLDYGVIEDACDTSPVALMPGISISSTSACTLGALFKTENETETGKSFILTVKHGVGNTGDKVIQPGSIDAGKGYTICAEVTEYNYYGVIEHGGDTLFLDYAFCEVIPNGIASTSNTPIQCEICIDNTKDSLSGRDDKYDVYKVGKKTHSTEGWVSDMLQIIRHRKFGKVKTLVVKSHENSKKIGAPGDSGSPVFDKHNRLWGIIQGISACGSKAIVIPIHLILQHVQRTFGVSFKLINK